MHTISARQSPATALPLRLIQADLQEVGTHEPTDLTKLEALLTAFLSQGYQGPPVSVLHRDSDTLFSSLQTEEPLLLTTISYGDIGVADGHHRLQALRVLDWANLLAVRELPFQLVPARNPDIVRLASSIPETKPFTLTEIVACFPDERTVISDCATYFEARLADGTWQRLQESQPDVHIPLEDLVRIQDLSRTQSIQEIAAELVVAYLHANRS